MGHLITFSTLRTEESVDLVSSMLNSYITNVIEDQSWLVIRVSDDYQCIAVHQSVASIGVRNKESKASSKPQGMIISLETLAAFDFLDRTQGIDVAVDFIKSL